MLPKNLKQKFEEDEEAIEEFIKLDKLQEKVQLEINQIKDCSLSLKKVNGVQF